uniref:Uncharacterized protein n=1 Tax=Rangifer tarandus platyrhynchus TaxID=3082113 RepID=A0ACB0F6V3_RANTA|nr:unnamed protein product [Rangifer tarandus platyrhynchus]
MLGGWRDLSGCTGRIRLSGGPKSGQTGAGMLYGTAGRSVSVSCGRAQTRKDPEKLEGHPGPAGWELLRTGWPSCRPGRRGGVLAPPPGGPSAREPPHPEFRLRCAASSPSPIETETIPRIWLRFSARDPKAEPRSQASKDRHQNSIQHRLVGLGAAIRSSALGSVLPSGHHCAGSRQGRRPPRALGLALGEETDEAQSRLSGDQTVAGLGDDVTWTTAPPFRAASQRAPVSSVLCHLEEESAVSLPLCAPGQPPPPPSLAPCVEALPSSELSRGPTLPCTQAQALKRSEELTATSCWDLSDLRYHPRVSLLTLQPQ